MFVCWLLIFFSEISRYRQIDISRGEVAINREIEGLGIERSMFGVSRLFHKSGAKLQHFFDMCK